MQHCIPCTSSVTVSCKETFQEQLIPAKPLDFHVPTIKKTQQTGENPSVNSQMCNKLLYYVVSHAMNGRLKKSPFHCAIYSFMKA